jgi:muramidase (phage lysozyme)
MVKNRKAFLDMIAKAEGTFGIGDNGYNVLAGGTLFHSYHDHPRRRVFMSRKLGYSTAAGRYQILTRYFDFYKKELKLQGPDYFSPDNQDLIIIRYFQECHALDDIDSGRITEAIEKCKSRFASFPGANYDGQPTRTMSFMEEAYQTSGGILA